jgi:hypothetical protein
MEKFEFEFQYESNIYTAECIVFPIDGSSELHIAPRDADMFERFGVKILMRQSNGSITTAVPASGEEKIYVMCLAEGLANFYNNQQDVN